MTESTESGGRDGAARASGSGEILEAASGAGASGSGRVERGDGFGRDGTKSLAQVACDLTLAEKVGYALVALPMLPIIVSLGPFLAAVYCMESDSKKYHRDPSPNELARYRGESMSAAHRLGSTPFMIQHEDSVKGKRRTPKLKSGSVPSNRANEMWERNMAESSGSDGSRPTSRGGSARAGEAFAPSAGAIVEEGEEARLGRLTIASTPKKERGGEKPPNTPPNKSPTNRSPMRSPTASRGGSVRAGGQQPHGGVRGILRRRESEDQVADPTPAPAEDAAENGSAASSTAGAARSIDFDGLPAEDQEKSASPPRRHALLDARLDDDAFEHPAVMQRRVDDGYSSSASSVEAEFETFHANGSPRGRSPAGKANRAGGPRSKTRSPPSPSARASPKSMFGKVVGVFREGRRRSVDDDDASWRVGSVRENSLMDRESNDRVLEKLRAHAERGDAERRA